MAVSGNSYPALGFDPCPGDPDGVTQLASQWQDEIRAGNSKQAHGVSLSPADKRTLNGYQCDFTTIQQQAQQLHQDYFQAACAISREIDGILKLPSGKRGWYGNAADQQQE